MTDSDKIRAARSGGNDFPPERTPEEAEQARRAAADRALERSENATLASPRPDQPASPAHENARPDQAERFARWLDGE
jgi:hypothetical protein